MRRSLGVAGVLALVVGVAGPAASQAVFDHLKCYQVKTDKKVKALVDLTPEQTQFLVEKDCKITGPKLLCVPVIKQNVRADPPPPGAPPGPPEGDHLCYALRCRKPFPQPLALTDQFGTFTVKPTGTSLLCTPARKGGTTTTTVTTTTSSTTTTMPGQPCRNVGPAGGAPMCGGDCPPATPKCVFVTSANVCECVPTDLMCMPQGTGGQCNGLCPDAGQQCLPNTAGGCDCARPCQAGPFPACGGVCPPNLECRPESATGQCLCLDTP